MGARTVRDLAMGLMRALGLFASLGLILNACGGSGAGGAPPGSYTAKGGVAQKGPLIKGSAVVVQQVDANLSPTGQQFSYQVTNDFGSFSATSTFTSEYLGIAASGYYFDEVQGAVSAGPVTLNGYSDVSLDSYLNVNLLTTLAYQRIQTLVTGSKMTFAAARTQAESEVLAALNIPRGSYGSFDSLDLSGTSDGDHILTAVSTLFVYGNSAGPLSQLIAAFQSDIGTNGVITNTATKAALSKAAQSINAAAAAANLTAEYSSEGLVFTDSDITEWIAQSGDGVIGKYVFQVPDATPSSVFTLPSSVVTQFAGLPVALSTGRLSLNGTLATGAIQFKAGDTVTVSPPQGTLPNGILTVYLISGTTNLCKISFLSGLLSIAVTPSRLSLPVGLTQQFKATGTFSDTSTADLTNAVAWSSSAPATSSVSETSGLVTALAAGSATITAVSGSVAGSTMLTVTSAVLQSISITPSPAVTGVGITKQLNATGTYSDASTANVTSTGHWTSSALGVSTIGPTTGMVTGVGLGSTTISVAIGALSATAPLTVAKGVWGPTGSMLVARQGHSATLLPNGKVLIAGGEGLLCASVNGCLASAEIYDPVAGAWSATGSLVTPRDKFTATLLPNGTVLVVGGQSNGNTAPLASAEIYDPGTGVWTATGSLATARYMHTATLLPNGKVLVAGGFGNNTPLATAEVYDPASGSWSPAGSLTTARWDAAAILLSNGTVMVVGGMGIPTAGGVDPASTSADEYNPTTGTWSAGGSFRLALYGNSEVQLANGKFLFAGGSLTSGAAAIYDPGNGTLTYTGSLPVAFDGTLTLLRSGQVLAGGSSLSTTSGFYSGTELYDPAAGTWTSTGSLSTYRQGQSATLLPDGTVLYAGGNNGTPEPTANPPYGYLSSAEIYYP